MVPDIKVRKVAQNVLLYVCFKKEVIKEEPSPDLHFIPEITTELMKNMSIAVWIEASRNEIIWEEFFRNHFKRMVSSTYCFVNYVAYVFYVLINQSDVYDSFLDTLSIVTNIAFLCWEKERKVYFNICVDLFCEFFEKELRAKFEDKGGWYNLKEYLLKHASLMKYEALVSANMSPFEYFEGMKNEIAQNNELIYVVNEVSLSFVTQKQVETHKKVINFNKSVEGKIKELCKLTFGEILVEFAKTDRQLEDNYRQQVKTGSGGMTNIKGQSLLQSILDDALENIPSKTTSEKKELKRETITASDPFGTQNSCTVDSLDAAAPVQSLDLGPKSRKSKTKGLLDDLSTDISNLRGLVLSLCEDHGMHKQDW